MRTQVERISVRSDVCHGKPCIAGTRIMVSQILELIEAGRSFGDIKSDYFPDVSDEDIRASIRLARKLVQNEEVHFAEESIA